ncbi:hypothetical protein GOBAR_DD21276 [Gossypium barbadense]|nr:hypothetical protein GOBAR_DD21276 [Gossypium barbadense]
MPLTCCQWAKSKHPALPRRPGSIARLTYGALPGVWNAATFEIAYHVWPHLRITQSELSSVTTRRAGRMFYIGTLLDYMVTSPLSTITLSIGPRFQHLKIAWRQSPCTQPAFGDCLNSLDYSARRFQSTTDAGARSSPTRGK